MKNWTDDRFIDFIKQSEKTFDKLNINCKSDFDNLDDEREKQIEKPFNKFERIFEQVWNETGNLDTAKTLWKNSYKDSKYSYIFEIFN